MTDRTPSQLIDQRIADLGDWRGDMLAKLRGIVKAADPEIVEEWKWRGVPTWYRDGMICTGETYKAAVKMTFAKGASLDDPAKLFNASLDGNVRRAIDFHEGDTIDEPTLTAMIHAAIKLNRAVRPPYRPSSPRATVAALRGPAHRNRAAPRHDGAISPSRPRS